MPASDPPTRSTLPRLLVIAPLRHEWRALRTLRGRRFDIDVICCGPGQAGEALGRIARTGHEVGGSSPAAVVLAGLGGGLDPALPAGSAHWARTIIDCSNNDRLVPTFGPALLLESSRDLATSAPGVIVATSDSVIASIDAKRHLRERAGAHIVDMESAAFARTADDLGIPWGVVRGVSDDAHTALPAGIEQWIDHTGATRGGAVMASLLRSPTMLPRVVRLGRASRTALREVRALLAQAV